MFRIAFLASNQRFGQSVRMRAVVPPITSFHTQSFFIYRAVAPFCKYYLLFCLVECDGTADSAIRTDTVNRFLGVLFFGRGYRFMCQSTCGASGSTLATGDTTAFCHKVVQIKSNTCQIAFSSSSYYVVRLNVIASTNTTVT